MKKLVFIVFRHLDVGQAGKIIIKKVRKRLVMDVYADGGLLARSLFLRFSTSGGHL